MASPPPAAAGSSAAAVRAFFRGGNAVALGVYDTRRGQAEGREAEKILAFYPPTAPAALQASVVGLAQALTMFGGTFNKECPFHSMEAAQHQWAMYHAEPDLWLLLVLGRGLAGPTCLPAALSGLLKGLHGVAVAAHGLLSSQLEQDPAGVRVRRRLQPLLQEAAASLLQHDAPGLAALSCPLGLTGGVPLLQLSSGAFTRLQSLTNSLLVCRLFGCRPVLGVLAAWQTCLLWSSLGSHDTAALHSLVVRGLEPAVREGPRHKALRGGPSGPAPQDAARPGLPPGSSGGSSSGLLHDDSVCLASPSSWCVRADGLVLPVGLAAPAGDGGRGAAELPTVWLQSGVERARLMAWHSGPLLLLLLLDDAGPAVSSCPAVTTSLAGQLDGPGASLAAQLAAELPAKHLWHVQGVRYRYHDALSAAVRASPLRKVATLSSGSLQLAADARRWAALEVAAAADPSAAPLGPLPAADGAGGQQRRCGDGGSSAAQQWESFAAGGADADVELVVRGAGGGWLVVRHTGAGRQLAAVVEGDRDKGMAGVVRRVDALCDVAAPGAFEGLA